MNIELLAVPDDFGVRGPVGVARTTLGLLVGSFSFGGRGNRLLNQACLRAELGVIRASGSHSKHRWMKSKKRGSSHPKTYFKDLKPCSKQILLAAQRI